MRTITIENRNAHYFVTDWNHKQWVLIKNTDDTFRCTEIRDRDFHSVENFIFSLYGFDCLNDSRGKIVFVNYKIEKKE